MLGTGYGGVAAAEHDRPGPGELGAVSIVDASFWLYMPNLLVAIVPVADHGPDRQRHRQSWLSVAAGVGPVRLHADLPVLVRPGDGAEGGQAGDR